MSSLTRTKPGQKLYFWRKNVIICLCQTLRDSHPSFHFAFSAEYILVVAIVAAIVAAIDAAIVRVGSIWKFFLFRILKDASRIKKSGNIFEKKIRKILGPANFNRTITRPLISKF